MATYNELIASSTSVGSIANWVNHTAAQAAAPMIIQEAESIIYRRLRHWKMLTSTTGTMTTSQATVTVPSDFLEDKLFRITGTAAKTLTRKTIQEVISRWSYDSAGARVTSQPDVYSNDQTNFQFDSPCDQAYPYLLSYYAQPVALGTGTATATNFITGSYPRLLRAVCMAQAGEFMKESSNYNAGYWAQMAEVEIEQAQRESDMHERSASLDVIII